MVQPLVDAIPDNSAEVAELPEKQAPQTDDHTKSASGCETSSHSEASSASKTSSASEAPNATKASSQSKASRKKSRNKVKVRKRTPAHYHTEGTGHLYQGVSRHFPSRTTSISLPCFVMSSGIHCAPRCVRRPTIGGTGACGGACSAMGSRELFLVIGLLRALGYGSQSSTARRMRRSWKHFVAVSRRAAPTVLTTSRVNRQRDCSLNTPFAQGAGRASLSHELASS